MRRLVEDAVATEVQRHIAGWRPRFGLIDVQDLPALTVPKLRRMSGERLIPLRTRGSAVTDSGSIPTLPWGNRITVSVFHLKEDAEPEGTPLTVKCLVSASRTRRGIIWIAAALLELWSGHVVDVAVPFVLSGFAMAVCLFKLAFFFPVQSLCERCPTPIRGC